MEKSTRFNLTPIAPHLVDVMFLADATGSMSNCIADVKANIISSFEAFKKTVSWNIQLGISFYRDNGDTYPFQVLQKITGDTSLIQTAVNKLAAMGGGDAPEGQLGALSLVAERKNAGWRSGATRIIAWFGDEPGHDPVSINGVTYTLAGTIDALLERNVQVCAFSMAPSNRLDSTLQATKITEQVDGVSTNQFVQYKVKQSGVVAFILNFIKSDTP